MANVCQLDGVYSRLACLPESFNSLSGDGRTHPECGQHHSIGSGPTENKNEKDEHQCSSACFLAMDTM